jgi:hypothetical protein
VPAAARVEAGLRGSLRRGGGDTLHLHAMQAAQRAFAVRGFSRPVR